MTQQNIPVFVLPEHETIQGDDIERCPCGSSLFRIYNEAEGRVPEAGSEITWWQVCAVCGARQGGFTETFGEGNGQLRRFKGEK